MNNQTAGHCANSMGVRGHSAGTVFPSVILIKGSFSDGFTYHVLNHPHLDPAAGYNRYTTAELQAQLTPRTF